MSEHKCQVRGCLECAAEWDRLTQFEKEWQYLEDAELAAYNPREYRRRQLARAREERRKARGES